MSLEANGPVLEGKPCSVPSNSERWVALRCQQRRLVDRETVILTVMKTAGIEILHGWFAPW